MEQHITTKHTGPQNTHTSLSQIGHDRVLCLARAHDDAHFGTRWHLRTCHLAVFQLNCDVIGPQVRRLSGVLVCIPCSCRNGGSACHGRGDHDACRGCVGRAAAAIVVVPRALVATRARRPTTLTRPIIRVRRAPTFTRWGRRRLRAWGRADGRRVRWTKMERIVAAVRSKLCRERHRRDCFPRGQHHVVIVDHARIECAL
mmetsp:Transcript_14752/g.26074  ORF Transcript_14752/g.26074 Transcript_14752/m.26074 type:complete len:201 (-) Transcript_14752:1033-1635(-)